MRGYPGAGKSTEARELADQTGAVIVCRDNLRFQMFGKYDVGHDGEEAVTVAERAMVRDLLSAGRDVVIDACHLNPKYLKYWAGVAAEFGADWDIHDVLTEPADCIIQDSDIDRVRQGKRVGIQVITKLVNKWPMERWPVITAPDVFTVEPYVKPVGKPPAIIVDIDGTLAHRGERDPYDYSRVAEDYPDSAVFQIVEGWCELIGGAVLFVSGREDSCAQQTADWITMYGLSAELLFMRKSGDYRKDSIVKYEIFNKFIRDEYRVEFVLDDRDQVVKMWRALGLKCLQVQEGNF